MPGVCNGVFALTLSGNNGTFTLDGELPRQTLVLESYKVVHTSTLSYIRVDLPFISSSSIMNAGNNSRLCIPLEDAGVHVTHSPKWALDMKGPIQLPFTVNVYDPSGNLVNANEFTSIVLIFSFQYGQFN